MVAPTPQNTPMNNAPLTREALSRPTVGTIGEEGEDAQAGESPLSNVMQLSSQLGVDRNAGISL